MSRSVMLDRIRRACRSGAAADLPGRLPEFPIYEDPVQRFGAELEAANGLLLEGREEGSLRSALRKTLEASGAGHEGDSA